MIPTQLVCLFSARKWPGYALILLQEATISTQTIIMHMHKPNSPPGSDHIDIICYASTRDIKSACTTSVQQLIAAQQFDFQLNGLHITAKNEAFHWSSCTAIPCCSDPLSKSPTSFLPCSSCHRQSCRSRCYLQCNFGGSGGTTSNWSELIILNMHELWFTFAYSYRILVRIFAVEIALT